MAAHYGDLIDAIVIDTADAAFAPAIEATGVRAVVTGTVMRDPAVRGRSGAHDAGRRGHRGGVTIQITPLRAGG